MASVKGNNNRLLDPKVMDGPKISFTMNDIFISYPSMFLCYHCITTPFILFNMLGFIIGSGLYGTGLVRTIPKRLLSSIGSTTSTTPTGSSSSYAMISSTFGFAFGSLGSILGGSALLMTARKGENATPIPYTKDGIQQRVNGLSHNYMVRTLDISAWMGIIVTIGTIAYVKKSSGGTTSTSVNNWINKIQFSTGKLGVVQSISFGSAIGSICGMGYLFLTK